MRIVALLQKTNVGGFEPGFQQVTGSPSWRLVDRNPGAKQLKGDEGLYLPNGQTHFVICPSCTVSIALAFHTNNS